MRDYNCFYFVSLADQITVTGNEMCGGALKLSNSWSQIKQIRVFK